MTTRIDACAAYAEVATAQVIRSESHEAIAIMSLGELVRHRDIDFTSLSASRREGSWPVPRAPEANSTLRLSAPLASS